MPQVSSLTACVAATVLLVSAQGPATPPKSRSVGIFMEFESAPGEESVRTMEEEVSGLLKPSGVSLDWRMVKDNRGSQPFAGLVVLRFKGACKVQHGDSAQAFSAALEEESLGSTKVDHGRVLPYSEVECDRVRKALAYLGPGVGQKERQHALGVALGNVVAHELYHILASTTAHTQKGIAKASHSLQDLVSAGRLAFTEEDSSAIARGLFQK
jgi:hypothetical protein